MIAARPFQTSSSTPIKHLAKVTLGKMLQPVSGSDSDKRVRYLRSANVQEDGELDLRDVSEMWAGPLEQRHLDLRQGDVVVVEGGSVGRAAVLHEDLPRTIFQNSINRLRPTSSDGRFIAYALQAVRESGFFNVYCDTVSIAHLTAEKLGRVRIPAPPVSKQRSIADFLDRETAQIDALIEKQHALLDRLRERRGAVVLRNVTGGREYGLRRSPISGAEWLGRLPASWDVKRLGAVVTERNEPNTGYRRRDYLSLVAGRGVIPYAEKGDIGNRAPEDLVKCKFVDPGDYVINSMNYQIGAYGVSRYSGVCSAAYVVLQSRGLADHGFIAWVLTIPAFQQQVQNLGNGILEHRKAIGWDELKVQPIPFPPLHLQQEIALQTDFETAKIDELVHRVQRFLDLAKERRAALIAAAVSGQIDATAAVGAA